MPKRITAVVFLAIITITARAGSPEQDANWAQWRGPDATGAAPKADPPLEWSDTKNVKWKAELPARQREPDRLGRQRLRRRRREDRSRRRARRSAESRSEARKENNGSPELLPLRRPVSRPQHRPAAAGAVARRRPRGIGTTHSYAAGSPTTDGKLLYVSFGSFGIYCYDFDGNRKWSRDLGRLSTRLGWGEASRR